MKFVVTVPRIMPNIRDHKIQIRVIRRHKILIQRWKWRARLTKSTSPSSALYTLTSYDKAELSTCSAISRFFPSSLAYGQWTSTTGVRVRTCYCTASVVPAVTHGRSPYKTNCALHSQIGSGLLNHAQRTVATETDLTKLS